MATLSAGVVATGLLQQKSERKAAGPTGLAKAPAQSPMRLRSAAYKARDHMKITVEVTQADLAEMGVSAEQLEGAVKQEIEGGLDVDGDTLYINDADVTVVVAE